MSSIGLPIPPGYTITTEACYYNVDHDGEWPEGLASQVQDSLRHVGDAMGPEFSNPDNSLLVPPTAFRWLASQPLRLPSPTGRPMSHRRDAVWERRAVVHFRPARG